MAMDPTTSTIVIHTLPAADHFPVASRIPATGIERMDAGTKTRDAVMIKRAKAGGSRFIGPKAKSMIAAAAHVAGAAKTTQSIMEGRVA